jgi:hypothetical protein
MVISIVSISTPTLTRCKEFYQDRLLRTNQVFKVILGSLNDFSFSILGVSNDSQSESEKGDNGSGFHFVRAGGGD